MAELKTKSNDDSVVEFIEKVPDETKKKDCHYLLQLMETTTGAKPKLWSGGMVGFGDWHYKYESGREGDWFIMGFAPRKQNLTIYLMDGFGKYDEILARLGKHKTGKSCLYVKRLEDIDLKVLAQLVRSSFDYFVEKHGI